jgi:hypothetical protein
MYWTGYVFDDDAVLTGGTHPDRLRRRQDGRLFVGELVLEPLDHRLRRRVAVPDRGLHGVE